MQRWLATVVLSRLLVPGSAGVPKGWRREERFVGFRYELVPPQRLDGDVKRAIRDRADDLFCFGWTQDSPRNTVVGEVRCKTPAGREMKTFLASLADPTRVVEGVQANAAFLDHPDTLIRLHFSHFKILTPGRSTCFRDRLHRCAAEELVDPRGVPELRNPSPFE